MTERNHSFRKDLDIFYIKSNLRVIFKIFLLPFFLIHRTTRRFRRYHLDHLEIVVGSKCTLHCRKCANLMQYYHPQENFDSEQLVSDICDLLSLDIDINCAHLIGGEPFIYNELPALIKLLVNSQKVKSVRIITNGTVFPKDDLLRSLSHPKIHVLISNYSSINTKINDVLSLLKHHNIRAEVVTGTWYDYQHNFNGYHRTEAEKSMIYQNCGMDCHELVNGEIHLCPTSAHAMYLGLIPRDENSFVSIRHNGSRKQKRTIVKKIRRLFEEQVPNACEYCSGNSGIVVAAAEQLPAGTYINKQGEVVPYSANK